jgi:hypothetical protein
MLTAMKRLLRLFLLVGSAGTGLVSCAETAEKRPVGPPTTETSKIPWNSPIAGQGQGQMGMMPQNQHRR